MITPQLFWEICNKFHKKAKLVARIDFIFLFLSNQLSNKDAVHSSSAMKTTLPELIVSLLQKFNNELALKREAKYTAKSFHRLFFGLNKLMSLVNQQNSNLSYSKKIMPLIASIIQGRLKQTDEHIVPATTEILHCIAQLLPGFFYPGQGGRIKTLIELFSLNMNGRGFISPVVAAEEILPLLAQFQDYKSTLRPFFEQIITIFSEFNTELTHFSPKIQDNLSKICENSFTDDEEEYNWKTRLKDALKIGTKQALVSPENNEAMIVSGPYVTEADFTNNNETPSLVSRLRAVTSDHSLHRSQKNLGPSSSANIMSLPKPSHSLNKNSTSYPSNASNLSNPLTSARRGTSSAALTRTPHASTQQRPANWEKFCQQDPLFDLISAGNVEQVKNLLHVTHPSSGNYYLALESETSSSQHKKNPCALPQPSDYNQASYQLKRENEKIVEAFFTGRLNQDPDTRRSYAECLKVLIKDVDNCMIFDYILGAISQHKRYQLSKMHHAFQPIMVYLKFSQLEKMIDIFLNRGLYMDHRALLDLVDGLAYRKNILAKEEPLLSHEEIQKRVDFCTEWQKKLLARCTEHHAKYPSRFRVAERLVDCQTKVENNCYQFQEQDAENVDIAFELRDGDDSADEEDAYEEEETGRMTEDDYYTTSTVMPSTRPSSSRYCSHDDHNNTPRFATTSNNGHSLLLSPYSYHSSSVTAENHSDEKPAYTAKDITTFLALMLNANDRYTCLAPITCDKDLVVRSVTEALNAVKNKKILSASYELILPININESWIAIRLSVNAENATIHFYDTAVNQTITEDVLGVLHKAVEHVLPEKSFQMLKPKPALTSTNSNDTGPALVQNIYYDTEGNSVLKHRYISTAREIHQRRLAEHNQSMPIPLAPPEKTLLNKRKHLFFTRETKQADRQADKRQKTTNMILL